MSDNPVKALLDQAFLRPTAPLAMHNRPANIEIVIRFGQSFEEDPDGDRSTVETFRFFTKEEADAFMTGVESACGWCDHEVLEDGRYPR